MEYDDGLIACGSDALLIRRYTLLLRPRRVSYADIRSVTKLRLDVGGRVRPTITPDDPQQVVEILRRHGVHVSEPA